MTIEETIEKYGLYLGIPVFFLVLISTTFIKTAADNTVGTMDPNIVAYIVIGVFTACLAVLAAHLWSNNRQLRDQLATTRKTVSANSKAALNVQPNEHHDQADRTGNGRKKMTDQLMLKLSHAVPDEVMRQDFGAALRPSGLNQNEVDTAGTNNEKQITLATQNMLKKWRQKQDNDFVAWDEMIKALKAAKLKKLIEVMEEEM